jgi:hypothetical protein
VEAVKAILDCRLGKSGQRSPNPDAARPFTLWFNSSPEFATSDARRTHLETIRSLVLAAAGGSRGRLRAEFRPRQEPGDAGWDVFP